MTLSTNDLVFHVIRPQIRKATTRTRRHRQWLTKRSRPEDLELVKGSNGAELFLLLSSMAFVLPSPCHGQTKLIDGRKRQKTKIWTIFPDDIIFLFVYATAKSLATTHPARIVSDAPKAVGRASAKLFYHRHWDELTIPTTIRSGAWLIEKLISSGCTERPNCRKTRRQSPIWTDILLNIKRASNVDSGKSQCRRIKLIDQNVSKPQNHGHVWNIPSNCWTPELSVNYLRWSRRQYLHIPDLYFRKTKSSGEPQLQ